MIRFAPSPRGLRAMISWGLFILAALWLHHYGYIGQAIEADRSGIVIWAILATFALTAIASPLLARDTIEFVADILLSLGLLGTVIGFIFMLGPLSQATAGDHASIQMAISVVAAGMATALVTTLAGILGNLGLRLHAKFLGEAVP